MYVSQVHKLYLQIQLNIFVIHCPLFSHGVYHCVKADWLAKKQSSRRWAANASSPWTGLAFSELWMCWIVPEFITALFWMRTRKHKLPHTNYSFKYQWKQDGLPLNHCLSGESPQSGEQGTNKHNNFVLNMPCGIRTFRIMFPYLFSIILIHIYVAFIMLQGLP